MKFKNKQPKFNNLPKHIAFIIDGNGRWAQKRGLTRHMGHRAGILSLKNIINYCFELGIEVVSVYGFSTENWKRPKEEVDGLFDLFSEFVKSDFGSEIANVANLNVMGDYTKFPDKLSSEIEKCLTTNKNANVTKVLNLGLNYGGQSEILRAINNIVESGETDIDKQKFEKYLYTSNLPNPDFIVRTSGEQRLSNFMLWQGAYSELYFPKTFWPDFNRKSLNKALKIYQKRNRRFGEIKEKAK